MAKPFDATSKHLFQNHARDWIALAGLPVPATSDQIHIVDADLSTISPAVDKLVRVELDSGPYIAHLEFQTSPDPDFDERMLFYHVIARRRHKLDVMSAAFLLRPQATGPTGKVSSYTDTQSWLDFSYRIIRPYEMPVESLLNGPIGLLPLAPLAVGPASLPDVIRTINRRLQTEVSPNERRDTLECTQLLMGMRFDSRLVESLMASLAEALKESSVYKEYERREQEFEQRELRLKQRAVQFEQKETQLEGRKNELEGRETQLEGRETQLEGRETQLEGRETQLEGRENQLEGRENQLEGRENQLEARQRELEAANANKLLNVQRNLLIELGTEKFGPPNIDIVARIQSISDFDQITRTTAGILRAASWDQLLVD